MDQSFELEISFSRDCAICKGHYHNFSNSDEHIAANFELVDNDQTQIKTELDEAGRKTWDEMKSS